MCCVSWNTDLDYCSDPGHWFPTVSLYLPLPNIIQDNPPMAMSELPE